MNIVFFMFSNMASTLVSFTKPLVLDFEGNIYKNAIAFGDVDNDCFNEFIVGNDKGDLAIFKGENTKPVRIASELGLITCVAVGDLVNIGRNVLLVITSCGSCYVYDFKRDPLHEADEKKLMICVHSQKLPANIKMAIIGDVNGDGYCEVAVALTDRFVRTYKWVDSSNSAGVFPEGKLIGQNKWELSDQIGGIALNQGEGLPTLLVSQPGGTCFTLNPPTDEDTKHADKVHTLLNNMSIEFEALDSASCGNPKIQTEICGDIEMENQSSFREFVASSSKAAGSSGSFLERATQHDAIGYTLATVNGLVMLVCDRKIIWKTSLNCPILSISPLLVLHKSNDISKPDGTLEKALAEMESEGNSPNNFHLFSSQNYSKFTTSAKGFRQRSNSCTPTKTPILIPNIKPQRIANSKRYGQPLVTKIVACSPDGTTFILNASDGRYKQFNFPDTVCCCIAGFYGYKSRQKSCVAYATFTGEIILYHDVANALEHRPQVMDLLKSNSIYVETIKNMGLDIENKEQMRQLNSYLMYGYENKTLTKGTRDDYLQKVKPKK